LLAVARYIPGRGDETGGDRVTLVAGAGDAICPTTWWTRDLNPWTERSMTLGGAQLLRHADPPGRVLSIPVDHGERRPVWHATVFVRWPTLHPAFTEWSTTVPSDRHGTAHILRRLGSNIQEVRHHCSWSPRYAHWRPGAVHGWPSPTAMGSRRGDRRRTAVGCSVDDQLGRVGPGRASAVQRQAAASTTAERGTPLRVRSLRKSPRDVSCHSVPRRVASVGAMVDSRGLGCLSRELGGIATTSFVGHCDAGRRSPRAVVGVGPVANAGENVDQCLTEWREGVVDCGGDGCVGVTGDQAVALEAAQRLSQHLLGDAVMRRRSSPNRCARCDRTPTISAVHRSPMRFSAVRDGQFAS
jgi:hypothetical protein